MSNFIHFIPYVNRMDLLKKAVASVTELWRNTIVIDNRNDLTQPDPRQEFDPIVDVMTPQVPLTTAQTMNLMLQMAGNKDFFTWMHTDAEAVDGAGGKLVELACNLQTKWGIVYTNYDAMAAYNVKALKEVGGWDWLRFPFYFLDNDIAEKVTRAGYTIEESKLPVIHHKSATIESDRERKWVNDMTFHSCKIMFSVKWGYDTLTCKK